MLKRWKLIVGVILLILVLAAAGFVVWASTPLGPMPEAKAALQSDSQVQVTTDQWTVFRPAGQEPTTGFIFYPGGRVAADSYTPDLHAIAAKGYLVVLVPMPLNLAVFGADKAADVIKAFPKIQRWAIGGHSLGGSMAARFANQNPSLVQGLVLWASYPDTSNNLSKQNIAVISVYGTKDGVVQKERFESGRSLLPADTQYLPIEGGNHGQFGWYGAQPGDNEASITRDQQQEQAVQDTVDLLAKISQ
jgi:dienelactone hydrolase